MQRNDPISHIPFRIARNTLHSAAYSIGAPDKAFFIWAAFHACRLLDMNEMRIEPWIPAIVAAVRARYIAKPSTANKAADEVGRLLRHLSRVAVFWWRVTPQMIADWCSTARPTANKKYPPVAPNTASNRGWAARAALEATQALGVDIDAADLLGDTPKRQPSNKAMRPLTRAEAAAVRTHARGGIITSDLSLLVALGLAGASASETATVTAAHIDADRGFVRLPGTDKVKARINPLDDWGQRTVSFQLRNRPGVNPNEPLCVTPGLPLEPAKHSVTVRLRKVLQAAGISHRPGVVPRSIRYTTAHRIAHAHGLIAAVKFLGVESVNDAIDVFSRALPEGGRNG